MINSLKIALALFGFLSCAAWAVAQDNDAEGSKDHPLISGYSGSVINGYAQKEFDDPNLAKQIGTAEKEKAEAVTTAKQAVADG